MTLRIIAAILLLAVAVPAAGRPAQAADPIEIPAILPITGPAAFLGRAYTETLKIIEDRTNSSGGVKGRPIHFVISDDQTSPQLAVQLTNSALTKNPALIINGSPLAMCAAVAPLMKNGPVLLCFSPSLNPDPGSFGFTVMSSTHDTFTAVLNMFKSRGYKRIAVLNGTDATGADADQTLNELIKLPEYSGLTFVAYEHFNLADLSVGAQVSRIKAAGAQALIAYTTGAPIATVLHGVADAGLDIPVFTSSGNMSIAQLDGYKGFVPKELLFASYPAFDAQPVADREVTVKIVDFRAAMKAAGLAPDVLHAIPWDSVGAMIEGYRRTGPAAGAGQLRDAVEGIVNWPGMLGRFDFRTFPNRGLGVKSLVILKWDPLHSSWTTAAKI